MGGFAYRPLVKQVGHAGRDVPLSAIATVVGEGGQPISEVGPIAIVVEVTPNALSSILEKRKRDEVLGRLVVRSRRPI